MNDRTYEYRFVAAGGLERRDTRAPTPAALNPYSNAVLSEPRWHRVEGKHFLFMTWEELEHVAHVIRDASRPKTEGEAA